MKKKHYLLILACLMSIICIGVATIPFHYNYVVHEWASFTLFIVVEILGLYAIYLFVRAYKTWTEDKPMYLKIEIPIRWVDQGAWILSKFLEGTQYKHHDSLIHGYWNRLCNEHTILRFDPYVFSIRRTSFPAGVLTITDETESTIDSAEMLQTFNKRILPQLEEWAIIQQDKVEKQ